MSGIKIISRADKLQDLELCLMSHHGQEVGFGRVLREAILGNDLFMEVEVQKSLGDLHLQKAKLSKDSAKFDKAAALYAAALLRCTDPDMRQTLEHRIGYMEKLSKQLLQGYTPQYQMSSDMDVANNVLRVAQICHTLDIDGRKSQHSVEDIYTNALVASVLNNDEFLETEVLKSLGDFYLEKGETPQFSKAAAMYNKALTLCKDPDTKLALEHRRRQTSWLEEKHFAAALKKVHVEDGTAQQYQREVEPLCKLGDVYSKRGQQTGDRGDFVKAAALYNAAIARSEDQVLNGNMELANKEVKKLFLKCVLGLCPCNVSKDFTENHKKQLKQMRDQIKLEMETIDQQLDPYVHDEDDPFVREIEAKRAQAVRKLFDRIARQRKEFISQLVEECIGLMGPPPCKYALIGLGSQATGLVTPYSDLEFAILVEEESEPCLVYFRNLTHYLHLKVVNLGETILPALGIKSLNDFYSKDPLDDWYYDSVTPRGFAFDGSMPKASKTPLGRQGTNNKPPSELIRIPENMVSVLQQDFKYLKDGYHLASILSNPCLIAGDQGLIDTYMAITEKILQADGGEMVQQLVRETLKEDMMSIRREETITARLINVKKDIYRFPAIAVECLAQSAHIIPKTVWKTIEEMEDQQVISHTNAHNLTVLTSISAELRLRTYIANGGQKENLSAMASMEMVLHGQESSLQTNDQAQTNMLKPVFHLTNVKQLLRYYYTLVPLQRALSELSGKPTLSTSFSEFYENSAKVCGMMYFQLCRYRMAISYYEEALKKDEQQSEKMYMLSRLARAWQMVGDWHKAISYHEQALEMCSSIYDQSTAHPDIAMTLNYIGGAWDDLCDYSKAISYHEQALQMCKSIYGLTTHPDTATSLTDLASTLSNLGDYRQATSYYEQALQMYRGIYGQKKDHPYIATSLNNLGSAWYHLGDYRKAISYLEQALQMKRKIYGQSTAHPDIAISLNNLGSAYRDLGDYRRAIKYHEQALLIKRSIYGHTTAHSDIANSLSNLGSAYINLGGYRTIIKYHKEALQMKRRIHGESKAHPDIASSLNSLGEAWRHQGDYRKEISYHEQALQMYRSIYGQTSPHCDTAISLNNLGKAWENLGDYRKATSYYEQALRMFKSVYGQSTAHPHTATTLNNLGSIWAHVGVHRKSVSYHIEALQMHKSVYGQDTAHPSIAAALNNLGTACEKLGDYKKAIQFYELALQMYRNIYGQNTAHPHIANLLNNLGSALDSLGNYKKAISYLEQALQMKRSIYGQGTAHRDVANSLNSLGTSWYNLGDCRKAISYCQEALAMARQIYPQNRSHPFIKAIESNLAAMTSSQE
ncbi:uncharacterized protein LOC144880839 [Branchiostoma floridae x Branchiostoma japonicum]